MYYCRSETPRLQQSARWLLINSLGHQSLRLRHAVIFKSCSKRRWKSQHVTTSIIWTWPRNAIRCRIDDLCEWSSLKCRSAGTCNAQNQRKEILQCLFELHICTKVQADRYRLTANMMKYGNHRTSPFQGPPRSHRFSGNGMSLATISCDQILQSLHMTTNP